MPCPNITEYRMGEYCIPIGSRIFKVEVLSPIHRVPTHMSWQNVLTFWGEFSLTFPDLGTVVYIQRKQLEDNVSSSTSNKNILAYVKNKELAWRQVELRLYLKMCRARGRKFLEIRVKMMPFLVFWDLFYPSQNDGSILLKTKRQKKHFWVSRGVFL